MTKYTAGFLFSPDLARVVLIRKQNPKWQAGKYNGIGGKIENGETSHEAMIREFKEETGVYVPQWHKLCTIEGADENAYSVDFYYSVSGDYVNVQTMEEEEVLTLPADQIDMYNVIDNLVWLIPLAIDKIKNFSGKITI